MLLYLTAVRRSGVCAASSYQLAPKYFSRLQRNLPLLFGLST